MHAFVVIETFDPIDDVELGQRTSVVAQQMRALDLEHLEEALHRRVDAPTSSKLSRVRQVSEN